MAVIAMFLNNDTARGYLELLIEAVQKETYTVS